MNYKHATDIDNNGNCLCLHCRINTKIIFDSLDFFIEELLHNNEIDIVDTIVFFKDLDGQTSVSITDETQRKQIDEADHEKVFAKIFEKSVNRFYAIYANDKYGYNIYDRKIRELDDDYQHITFLDDDGLIQVRNMENEILSYEDAKKVYMEYLHELETSNKYILRHNLQSFFYSDKVFFEQFSDLRQAILDHFKIEKKVRCVSVDYEK